MPAKTTTITHYGRSPIYLMAAEPNQRAIKIPESGRDVGSEATVSFEGADAAYVADHRAVMHRATGDRPTIKVG